MEQRKKAIENFYGEGKHIVVYEIAVCHNIAKVANFFSKTDFE